MWPLHQLFSVVGFASLWYNFEHVPGILKPIEKKTHCIAAHATTSDSSRLCILDSCFSAKLAILCTVYISGMCNVWDAVNFP